jgi:hypothetical protein
MPLRMPPIVVSPERPTWVTLGMLRLALLSLFVVAIGMIPLRLTPGDAWVVVVIGGGIAVAALAALLGATRRLGRRLGLSWAGEAFLIVIRRTGLPLLGLAFFLAWTVVYVAIWAVHPLSAFRGLAPHPRFADFFYYAVSTAFISPPGDVFAHSRGARSATMIEMLTAFALLTTYLASFVDWQLQRPDPSVSEDLS